MNKVVHGLLEIITMHFCQKSSTTLKFDKINSIIIINYIIFAKHEFIHSDYILNCSYLSYATTAKGQMGISQATRA